MPLRNKTRKRLDSKIEVYNSVVTDAEDFSPTSTLSLVATVYANVLYMSTKQVERIVAAQQTAFQKVMFTIRVPREYTISKSSVIKIVGSSEEFDIVAINKDLGRNQYWEIVTELKD
jgi:head-tail adaptor